MQATHTAAAAIQSPPLETGPPPTLASRPWWASAPGLLLGLHPRVLTGSEVRQALELLYEVYVVEQGWVPPEGNPSGLVADHQARELTDALVDQAIWVGVYKGDTLVGVTRLLTRSRCGCLEMERYFDLPSELTAVEGELVEPNRLAIHPDHRTSSVLVLLQLTTEWVARSLGAERSLATMTPRQAARVERHLGWHRAGLRLRYHPKDPSPVEVIRFDRADLAPHRTLWKLVVRQLTRRLGSRPALALSDSASPKSPAAERACYAVHALGGREDRTGLRSP